MNNIKWVSFKDLIKSKMVDLIIKSDPITPPAPTPAVPVEKVSCPHCVDNTVKTPESQHSSSTYNPINSNTNQKPAKEITLDHIAGRLHKYRYISGNTQLPHDHPAHPHRFDEMSTEEQNKHLANNSLQHLTQNELGALHLHIRKHSTNALKLAEERFNLEKFGDAYDPNELHDRIADNIANLFRPQFRMSAADSIRAVHGSKAKLGDPGTEDTGRLSRDELLALVKEGKHRGILDPKKTHKQGGYKYYFSSPLPSDRDLTGQELADFIKEQSTWGPRTARQHPKIGPLIEDKDKQVDALQSNKKQTSLAENKLNDFEKKTGVQSGNFIEMEKPYSFSELEKIAHGEGYTFNKVSDANGNLQSISVSRDGEEPSFSVDFKNGGKLSDIKQKLADLINPKEVDESHPVKQFLKHETSLKEIEPRLHQVQKEYDDTREKYELYQVEPEQHFANISEKVSSAGSEIEKMFEGISKDLKLKFNQAYTYFINGADDIGLGDGSGEEVELSLEQINNSIKNLKLSVQTIQSINLPFNKRKNMVVFVQQVTSAIKEAEALKKKYTTSSEDREKNLAVMFDKMKDAEDKRDDIEKEASYFRDKLYELSADPQVKEYKELKTNLDKKKQDKINKESSNPEMKYQTSLDIADNEGDSIGNYADKASYDKWKDEQQQSPDEYDDEYDDEGTPDEEIGNFVPYNLDYTDNEKINDASKNLLSYMNKKYSPKFVFGSKGKYSGIQRVASNIIANLVENDIGGDDTRSSAIVRNIVKSKPKNIKISDDSSWDKLSKIDPYIISKYAILSSKYCPHPIAPEDIYENPKGMFTQLIESMDDSGDESELTPDRIKKILGPENKFADTFYHLIYQIGNSIIESEYPKDSSQRQVLDKIKELNKDAITEKDKKSDKESIGEYPGKIRRRLSRQVDYLYGLHHKQVPNHHGLNHDIKEEEDAREWLKKINKHFGKTDLQDEIIPEFEDLTSEELEKEAKVKKWLQENGKTEKSLIIYQRKEPKMVIRL